MLLLYVIIIIKIKFKYNITKLIIKNIFLGMNEIKNNCANKINQKNYIINNTTIKTTIV